MRTVSPRGRTEEPGRNEKGKDNEKSHGEKGGLGGPCELEPRPSPMTPPTVSFAKEQRGLGLSAKRLRPSSRFLETQSNDIPFHGCSRSARLPMQHSLRSRGCASNCPIGNPVAKRTLYQTEQEAASEHQAKNTASSTTHAHCV